MRCIARGLPLPTVQWFSNGMAVSSARQQEVSVTVQTSHPHTKVYICVGVNRINNVEQRRSAEIKVIVGGNLLICTIRHDVHITYNTYM